MAEIIAELVKILPENQWLRFALIVVVVLLLVLREKFFLGLLAICRYVYRWSSCKIFQKHFWVSHSGLLDRNFITGTFIYRCTICGKTDVRPWSVVIVH